MINLIPPHLSKRENECLSHLIMGLTCKQIGKELNLSHRTIEFYIARMKTRFSCKTKIELILTLLKGHKNL